MRIVSPRLVADVARRVSRVNAFVWPPLEVRKANRVLDQAIDSNVQGYEGMVDRFLQRIAAAEAPELVIAEIERVEESELRRRELLESKASSLLAALGILVSLILLVPAIFERPRTVSPYVAISLSILVTIAVLHLLAAVYHAVLVSRVGALYLPSIGSVDALLKAGGDQTRYAAAQKYANARMNEPILTIKSNHLSMAQKMFLRGIVALAIAAVISFFYHSWPKPEQTLQPSEPGNAPVSPLLRPRSGPFN